VARYRQSPPIQHPAAWAGGQDATKIPAGLEDAIKDPGACSHPRNCDNAWTDDRDEPERGTSSGRRGLSLHGNYVLTRPDSGHVRARTAARQRPTARLREKIPEHLPPLRRIALLYSDRRHPVHRKIEARLRQLGMQLPRPKALYRLWRLLGRTDTDLFGERAVPGSVERMGDNIGGSCNFRGTYGTNFSCR
jgi:hypothetical protein